MVNLGIFTLLLALFLLTRGRFEGTIKARGILAGLTFVRWGKMRVVVWSHRPGRVYFRFSLAGGTA
jgi:hypothetical protein